MNQASRPHVLVLNYEYPPVGGGGGAASALLAKHLHKRGYQVTVQSGRTPGLPKYEVIDKIPVYRAFSFRRRPDRCSILEMGLFILCGFWPALKRVRQLKPDVLHVHFAVPTGVLGYLLHRLTGVPYVLTAHLGDVPGALPARTGWVFRLIKPFTVPIWRHAAAVVAVSSFLADLAQKAYGFRPQVIHNGHEPPQVTAPTGQHGPPQLIFAGRFDPQKNLSYMLDVLHHCREVPWQMHMVGDGPHASSFQAKAKKLGLADRCQFHGWLHPRQVDRHMAQCDILLLTSFAEGLPVVAVRALSFGLALAGSDIGGLHDVIRPGVNGILGPLDDADSFAKKLRELLISAKLRKSYGEASRDMAPAFDIRVIAAAYDRIFREIVRLNH